MTIIFGANFEDRTALFADIFVKEASGNYSVIEKVIPCAWVERTYFAGLGDELFMMILKDALADMKGFNWPPLASLDLTSVASADFLAQMATEYRQRLRREGLPIIQDRAAVYVANPAGVLRWQFRARNDDKYEVEVRTPEQVPPGYAFVDAGWCRPGGRSVAGQFGSGTIDQYVTFVSSWSQSLRYEVGTGITGVVIPHDGRDLIEARCLCHLSVAERTTKPKPDAA